MNDLSASLKIIGAQPYRVTADDFLRMVGAGVFGEANVELVEGELIEMAPAQTEHGRLMMVIGRDLGNAYVDSPFAIFGDTILRLNDATVRAPDIAVVDAEMGERTHLLGGDILLAVEISHSTLAEDLGRKRAHYAAAGIRNYWVVDIEGRRVHCFATPTGPDYADVRIADFKTPLSLPGLDTAIIIG